MSSIQAIVVDPAAKGRFTIQAVEAPQPGHAEAIVQVEAISLNRGEVKRAMSAEAGWRPGWDLAGTIIQAAADGSGPQKGSRVVGMVNAGAWAEQVAVPTNILAKLPAEISFAQASTLPVAGLTALRALEKGDLLLGKHVLITGSTGGVGLYALQLAHMAGAHVVGIARTEQKVAQVKAAGAHEVIVGEDILDARAFGPYHLILDSVGGKTLSNALTLLAPGGTCVSFGASDPSEVAIDMRSFFLTGGANLYGLILFYELARRPGAEDLSLLAQLIATGKLKTQIEVEAPWQEIGDVAQKLIQRQFNGKAVLHMKH